MMAAHQVHALLMGGQACVFYGAAEFSRDTDLVILAEPANWQRLMAALGDLQSECIAVPPCQMEYLLRGHALHFRCHHPEADDMRVDIMSVMRGVEEFPKLWERRTTLMDVDGTTYELLSLPDLVQAKKTQRSKDWPMIQRLVEADYLRNRAEATPVQVVFWLRELRTPELLAEAARLNPEPARKMAADRPLLRHASAGHSEDLRIALDEEEKRERNLDRQHWQPLKMELERLRHKKT